MKKFNFTQAQVSQILDEIATQEDGLNRLLQHSLEAMMRAERKEHNLQTKDLSNRYRFRKSFVRGKIMELQVPRSRKGNFYPVLLQILKDQE